MKRLTALIALLAIVAGTAAFALDAKKEIRVLASVTGGKNDEENKLFEQAMEKATGLSIAWERVPANYDQVLMQKLGAGEVYDLVYLNQFQMYVLAEQGAIADITARVKGSETYRKNVPQGELDQIAMGGKYFAGFNKREVFPLVQVNKALTDKAGVDLSKLATLDDYYQMLKKMKAYMEGTMGRKPYYPFFAYMTDVWDLQPWFSSAGLKRGVFVGPGGKRYAPYVDAKAKPVWEWLAKLYAEGLMDPESFTKKTGDMRNKMWQSQDILLDSDWAAWTGLYNNNARKAGNYPGKVNMVGLPGVKGPLGKYLIEQGQASLFAIPANAANPDGAFALLEFMATPEGALLLSAGIEGFDYRREGGKIVYTEAGDAHSRDHGAPFPISTAFDFAQLEPLPPGTLDSIAVGKRADVVVSPMGFADGRLDARQYYDVISKWMTDCIMGKLSADAAIKGAADELRAKKITD
jgi:putative aldouronate transport system substrate-binding protein